MAKNVEQKLPILAIEHSSCTWFSNALIVCPKGVGWGNMKYLIPEVELKVQIGIPTCGPLLGGWGITLIGT